MRHALAAATLFLAVTPAAAQEIRAEASEVQAHVEFLADDLLEGRGSGQRGYDLAALYVASRYRALGLEPAGDNGTYLQDILYRRSNLTGSEVLLDGKRTGGIKVIPNVDSERLSLDADLVFVGYGLEAGAYGHDSYAGVDVAGKIVVVFNGTPDLPDDLNSDIPAHLGNSKVDSAARRGAAGVITIGSGRFVNFFANRPTTAWIDDQGRASNLPGDLKMRAFVSTGDAKKLFARSGRDYDALVDAARKGDALPSFDLRSRMPVEASFEWTEFNAPNVVAKLPGANPAMADEHVAMTGHLDHLGIREDQKGDNIYNGALDNASGIATMLEAARLFATADEKPDRSIVFIAFSAEELGLLGASYYATNPTVSDLIGVVNLDMPVPLYDFTDVTAFGAPHNTVAVAVEEAGAEIGISVAPDPMPGQAIFTRSDHYEFAKKGIPAILLFTGYGNGGESKWNKFFADYYHQADDDLSLEINYPALARYAELNYRIAKRLANNPQRPLWYEGNFFGDLFAPDAPKAPAK